MHSPPMSPEKSISEQLAAILRQLNRNQLRFIVAMQECATKTEGAAAIGLKADTVLHWPKIVDDALLLIRQDIAETARAMNRRALLKAMAVKVAGLDSDDEGVRQRTATELIEWQLGKALQKVAQTSPDGTEPYADALDRKLDRLAARLGAAAVPGGSDPALEAGA